MMMSDKFFLLLTRHTRSQLPLVCRPNVQVVCVHHHLSSHMAQPSDSCVPEPAMAGIENSESQIITVNVQTLSGSLPPITIAAQATVRDLKQRVQALDSDFDIDRQKLLISEPRNEDGAGIVLHNRRTLRSYAIVDDTNVVLVMLPRPVVEVSIDDDELQDSDRFSALLANVDLCDISIEVSSTDKHRALLLQLFEANRFIQSIRISGCWTAEHLQFCESLVALRADIDIRMKFQNGGKDIRLLHRILNFCKSKRCSSVDLHDNSIDAADCASLAPALRSMSSLQHLDFSDNNIFAAGCASLAPALQSMSSLQHLNLRFNFIGAAGCASLAPALQSMPYLQHLNLSHNYIKSAGCQSLASALQLMSSLQHLNLSYNEIGSASCASLVPALLSMSSLQRLDIVDNRLDDLDCICFRTQLKSMSSLLISMY